MLDEMGGLFPEISPPVIVNEPLLPSTYTPQPCWAMLLQIEPPDIVNAPFSTYTPPP